MNNTNYLINSKAKKIFIVAGEASGDLHAGNLIRSIKEQLPETDFYGMGGIEMQKSGLRLTHDLRKVSVIGLVEVLSRLPTILYTLKELGDSLAIEKPDLAILVDFPDFNLKLAEKLKKAGIPVLWYISPQVWAWRAERIPKLVKLIDYMLVILPFEVEFYHKHNLNVNFVGHPLIDKVQANFSKDETRQQLGFKKDSPLIALLPGSRNIEIKLLLPHLKKASEILFSYNNNYQFVIPVANTLDPKKIETKIANTLAPIKVTQGRTYDIVASADCAVVAAGTATLETALLNTPAIIIGRVSRLTWFLWSRYTNLPYYGLPNYIIGKKLMTELIQHQASGKQIAEKLKILLNSEEEKNKLKEGYQEIRLRLGSQGASQKAAKIVIDILSDKGLSYRFS
ncbi:MAG: lipid-A-disaccharide synthase [Acidobacteria bacterium]|nr:lipid-A-disaccharide synthase [Acidobacteriota bacterium]